MPPDFRDQQRALTDWLRHPEARPAPTDVPMARLNTYRDLLFNNLTSFVENTFPVAQGLLPAPVWQHLTQSFFSDFHCQSPFFTDIPRHFREHVANQPDLLQATPWLTDLLHLEWMTLATDIAETDPPRAGQPGVPDDPDAPLRWASPTWPLAYGWPVHRWQADTPHDALRPAPTTLVFWRDTDLQTQRRVISPMAAWLVEQLADTPGLSQRQLAGNLQRALPDTPLPDGLATVRALLSDLSQHGLHCH